MPDQNSGPHSGAGGGESADHALSLREFARRLGISEKAVRKARDAGRLVNCIGKDGRVLDFDRAKASFASTSRTGVGVRTDGPQAGPQSAVERSSEPIAPPVQPPPQLEQQPELAEVDEDETGGGIVFAKTLIDAQTLATNERARKLKFENDVTEGRLVPAAIVAKEAFEAERTIREAILNLPARLAGELAAETNPKRVHARLDAALRECLTSTAAILLETVNA